MISQPHLVSYDIQIRAGKYTVVAPDGSQHFIKPSTDKSRQKIYIVKANHSFLYVGKTSQSMSGRFRGGFNPAKLSGYHGYKWREKDADFGVDVWHFDPSTPARDVETIEAEVVFRFRTVAGYWPLGQHEIHFYELRQDLSVTADIIFSTSHGHRANYTQAPR